MKRCLCWLLALLLLGGCAFCAAEEDDFGENWEPLDSAFGFSLWYNADLLEYWTDEWEGAPADCLCPIEDHSGVAVMVCRGSRFSAALWDGWEQIPLENTEFGLEYPYEVTGWTDGEIVSEQWIISAADRDFVFIIQYEAGSNENWDILFHDCLSDLEFPDQPAVFRQDLRLDFFRDEADDTRFVDVIVDGDAEPVALLPLRELRDVSLEKIIWDEDTFEPLYAEPIFTAPVLRPGDGVKLFCYFPDVLPDLRVCYTDAEGVSWCLDLFQSGRDGSLQLIPEDDY